MSVKHHSSRELIQAALLVAKHRPAGAVADALASYLAMRHQSGQWPRLIGALQTVRQSTGGMQLELACDPDVQTTDAVRTKLANQRSNQSVAMTVNPHLLGGFRLHHGPYTVDRSFTTLVKQLKYHLEVHHG